MNKLILGVATLGLVGLGACDFVRSVSPEDRCTLMTALEPILEDRGITIQDYLDELAALGVTIEICPEV